ncbi:MAG: hypothetical protein V1819_01320 [bacterium]
MALDQEKVYQILSKGIVFTMEDDLKEAMQNQKIKPALIPKQVRIEQKSKENKELEAKPIFTEKAHFDPFQKLEQPKVEFELIKKPEGSLAVREPSQSLSGEQLLQKRDEILEKIKKQKLELEEIFQKTEAIKLQKNQIEKQEQEAKDGQAKHSFEEQRWQVEEKFKKAQDLQWLKEEEIEKAQMVLSKIDSDYRIVQDRKRDLAKKQQEEQKFLQSIELAKQREEILEKNQEILKNRPEVEAKYNELLLQKSKIEEDLLVVIQEEQKVEEQAKNIEKQIQEVMNASERRKLEQERREAAQKRQIQEKKRWEVENLQKTIKENASFIEESLSRLKQQEQAVKQKIAEIDASLATSSALPLPSAITPSAPPPILPEPEPKPLPPPSSPLPSQEQDLAQKKFIQEQIAREEKAMDQEQALRIEEENRQEAIKQLKQIAQQEQEKLFTGKLRGPLLKEEILKKLTKVSPEEEAQRKDFLSRINRQAKPLPHQKLKSFEESVVFHPMIKKTSLFEKISIRILIVILIVGFGFGVYFAIGKLTKKEQSVNPIPPSNSTTTESPTTEWPDMFPEDLTQIIVSSTNSTSSSQASPELVATTSAPQATTTPPAIITPLISLITVSKNNIFAYQENFQPIITSIEVMLKDQKPYNSFEQISIFDEKRKVFLNAAEIFEAMGAVFPVEIGQEIGTSTILVFSSKFGNRLGFVLQTENTVNLKNSFLAWESQAETSTAPVFDLMGKNSPAMSKIFKNVTYKKISIRCQAFTTSDLGICYSVYKDYFIWTSSYEQMQRIVDKLP